MSRFFWSSPVALGVAVVLASGGCSSGALDDSTGSLSLQLTIAGGVEIGRVDWEITGGNMDPMSGSIRTSAPGSTASIEVFGLAPGEGYEIAMEAAATDGKTTCEGSAMFDIEPGKVTAVMVMLNCTRPERLGGVRVNGKLNVCAELTKVVVSPLQTSVGNDIDLDSAAVDVEGDPIAYLWSGAGGTIADPQSASTTYTCDEAGEHSVTIQVSDDGFDYCVSAWTVPVTCIDGNGGAGGSGGMGGSGGIQACVEASSMCSNGTINQITACCNPGTPPTLENACDGTESLVNPMHCTATGNTVTHRLTVLEVAGDCNAGYDLDRCNGSSCVNGGLAPGEGANAVDNALAGLAPVLAGVGGNLGGANQAFSDALCGAEDADGNPNTGENGCEAAVDVLDIQLAVDANVEENCANVTVRSGGEANDIILNLSDPTGAGTVCASGTLGTIPITIAGEPGEFGNAVVRMTVSEDGFTDGLLGVTIDGDTAVTIAEALLEGAGAVIAQVFDINADLTGELSQRCNALSATFEVGGVLAEGTGGTGGMGGSGGTAGTGGTSGTAPALVRSDPGDGMTNVPRTEWLELTFAEEVQSPADDLFSLSCNHIARSISAHLIEPEAKVVVINPAGELPASALCELRWEGPEGPETLAFSTAAAGGRATVLYDRTDASRYTPFPDDAWLVADETTRTGVRVNLPVPEREDDVEIVFGALKSAAQAVGQLDGFSPLGGIVIELSEAPDPASLPGDPTESLDPLASIGLFDLTPGSASYGQRVPFDLHRRAARRSSALSEPLQHALILFPSIALTPGGRYGLVVTRRAYANPARPFDPSSFMTAALNDPSTGEDPSVGEARLLAREVLDALAEHGSPPIPVDDVALVLRFSIRSTQGFPRIPLQMKDDVLALPAPRPSITRVDPGYGPWAAFVYGQWDAPDWRVGASLALDDNGLPVVIRTRPVEFGIGIPNAALSSPVPITMHQHGSGGSYANALTRSYLAEAGFAVTGFTDNLHREVPGTREHQNEVVLTYLLGVGKVPDYWIETTGEQLSFLRMLTQLCEDGCDFVPYGAPDGQPDLDMQKPLTYEGISEGSNKGQALMPYAPEIRAGALVVGGLRGQEIFFRDDPVGPGGNGTGFLDAINGIYPNIRPVDLWVGFSIFQLGFDYQDPQNHAAFMYQNPIEVAGTTRKPSVLVVEGLGGDDCINCTRSLAHTLGPVPIVEPVWQAVPYLPVASAPLSGNFDSATAGLAQYVAAGVPGIPPTPGCEGEPIGHYCAQSAPSSLHQRVRFFQTAVTDPVPTLVNPFED